jgi:hypothetical protein
MPKLYTSCEAERGACACGGWVCVCVGGGCGVWECVIVCACAGAHMLGAHRRGATSSSTANEGQDQGQSRGHNHTPSTRTTASVTALGDLMTSGAIQGNVPRSVATPACVQRCRGRGDKCWVLLLFFLRWVRVVQVDSLALEWYNEFMLRWDSARRHSRAEQGVQGLPL